MTNYEEIKKLLSASRKLLGGNQLTEDIKNIKKNYGLLFEQPVEDTDNKIDVMTDIEDKIQNDKYETAEKDEDEDEYKEFDKVKSDKKKAYRISGGILVIHSKNTTDLQLTTDDKSAFQESMDEFKQDVTEIVDFNKLNLYPTNVEWSGKITELDLDFFFSIGETNGVYINGTMTKLDDEFNEISLKLKTYYEKFKTKWSKIVSSRKKTSEI
tara:strand:- start:1337 stop:1972 length:636 start_codon:yes stop_codon:yes gene_type:complete